MHGGLVTHVGGLVLVAFIQTGGVSWLSYMPRLNYKANTKTAGAAAVLELLQGPGAGRDAHHYHHYYYWYIPPTPSPGPPCRAHHQQGERHKYMQQAHRQRRYNTNQTNTTQQAKLGSCNYHTQSAKAFASAKKAPNKRLSTTGANHQPSNKTLVKSGRCMTHRRQLGRAAPPPAQISYYHSTTGNMQNQSQFFS